MVERGNVKFYSLECNNEAETMTLQIPEKFSFDYLEGNINNGEWAEYVLDHSEEIMDRLDNCPFEEACWALSYSLSIWVGGKDESEETRHANDLIIRISRMGLNKLMKMRSTKKLNYYQFLEKQGDLLTKCATALINVGRPIAALNLFGSAETCFLQILDALPDNSEAKVSFSIEYECIRAKEAEVGVRIVHDIPKDLRPMFANAAYCYLFHSIYNLDELGDQESADFFRDTVWPYAIRACQKYPQWKQEEIDELNNDSIVDEHQRWCQENYLFLNIMNEIPHKCARYARDDIQIDLDEKHRFILDDIIQTYSHCRKILQGLPNSEEFMSKTERDEDVERLIDCFVRLYTVFDKCAKILVYLFPQDSSGNKEKFYEVARKLACENNPYLKAIDMICSDVFPDKASKIAGVHDPRNSFNGRIMWRGFLRNSIMHNTFKLKPDLESNDWISGVAYVSAFELYHATLMTFHDLREIILNIQMAVEYSKGN